MGLLGKMFYHTGRASATRPVTSIFIGIVIIAIGSIGFINFQSTVSISTSFIKTTKILAKARNLNYFVVIIGRSARVMGTT